MTDSRRILPARRSGPPCPYPLRPRNESKCTAAERTGNNWMDSTFYPESHDRIPNMTGLCVPVMFVHDWLTTEGPSWGYPLDVIGAVWTLLR